MPSLRNFISRLAEPKLLTVWLEKHDIQLESNTYGAKAAEVAHAIESVISDAPLGTHDLLMADVDRVEKLANEQGEVAIETATVHDDLANLPSRHARALYVYLHDEAGFRRAEEIVYSDTRRLGRDWTAFGGKEGLDPTADPAAVEVFKEALRGLFDTPNVHVEIFERSRAGFPDGDENEGFTQLTQIAIYREDRPNTELAFLDDGALGTHVRRQVIDAALTYEPATGIIECVGSHRDSRKEMARLMATTLLKCEPDFEAVQLPIYDLKPLSERIAFDSDPEDRIEDVRVTMLRLSPVETSTERIIVESLPSNDRDIWATVESRLGPEALVSHYQIDQARLVIRYRPRDSNRTRSLPIIITHPHRSNIKDRVEIERLVANKYLPRWGLVAA